jgi:ubiquinol-cytochrome c reductase cytochrome b subunit
MPTIYQLMKKKINNNNVLALCEKPWNQWLAGLIDGDGYFYINKRGQAYFEITVAMDDIVLLQRVKQKVGGQIKLRSGAKAARLRTGVKDLIIQLLNRINGEVRHDVRVLQVKKLCTHFGVNFKEPTPLTIDNAYMAGLFDADGSITIGVQKTQNIPSITPGSYGKYLRLKSSRGHHQLSVHIVSKNNLLLKQVYDAFGFGKVIVERPNLNTNRPHTLYKWYFRSRDQCHDWLTYLRKVSPLRSLKYKRALMLNTYFDLRAAKVHLAEIDSLQHKMWDQFCRRWHRIDL